MSDFCRTWDEVAEAIKRFRATANDDRHRYLAAAGDDRRTLQGLRERLLRASSPEEREQLAGDIAQFERAIAISENHAADAERHAEEATALLRINWDTVFQELAAIRRQSRLTFLEQEMVDSWRQRGFCACVGKWEYERLQQLRILHMPFLWWGQKRRRAA